MSFILPWLWAVFTVTAALSQTVRNAMQRELTTSLGTVGATHVRFLFGLPFGILFLGVVLGVTGAPLPRLHGVFLGWTLVGAVSQIAATAFMLTTMKAKSFVVTTTYTKTEPVQVAIFGFVVLGDHLSLPVTLAIGLATAGVMLMSWPKQAVGEAPAANWRPAMLGIAAGSLFALSAVGFRAAIRSLDAANFVVAASTTLACGLAIQAVSLTLYLLARDRKVLGAIIRAWRPSMLAGFAGALASQFWFLAFAIETAARVRTLALIEIFFAQMISGRLFREKSSRRERAGLVLVALGCALIVNA
ncbi:MAG: DMT family transporter [Beijerinckiaceae bacterium]|nr:DMT family transporter [Beijerinckiaceae bacterium]